MADFNYELPWNGEPFAVDAYLSIDTETAVEPPWDTPFDSDYLKVDRKTGSLQYDLSKCVPPMVLATVSDGTRNAVIRPAQLPSFLRMHRDLPMVGHNVAFDYWVVREELRRQGDAAEEAAWRERADSNRLDDTMLLDFLLRLADPLQAAFDGMRNLRQLAEGVGLTADKESPYRLRFHELIGADWDDAPREFFDYAATDTYVTWHVYHDQLRRTREIAAKHPELEVRWDRFGPLTSRLQTRAAIVLAWIGRNGMWIDREKRAGVKARLQAEADALVEVLAAYSPPLFRYYVKNPRTGERRVNRRTLVPNLNYTALREHLQAAARDAGIEPLTLAKTPTGQLATRLEYWRQLTPNAPIVGHWNQLADTSKILQFVAQVEGSERVQSSYQPLVRTGRTSCRSPNIQQMPKERWFRELFVPSPGHKYVIADYSSIELRTLAAVLLDLYGGSRLADVLRQGIDPHSFTASIVLGRSYEEVRRGVEEEKVKGEPAYYSKARQAAKAINFGVPGGLGVRRLCDYARSNYGVAISEDDASRLRSALIHEVYPELQQYLAYDIYAILAGHLQADAAELQDAMEWNGLQRWHVERVLRRNGETGNKVLLPASVISHVWHVMECYNRNPHQTEAIAQRRANALGMVGETAITLTGRIRAGLDYGEARNTRFQGLAADGAKMALWRLYMAGFRVVGFIHDEVICEVLTETAEVDRQRIEAIMKEEMASVLVCDVPVEVEGGVADSWVK